MRLKVDFFYPFDKKNKNKNWNNNQKKTAKTTTTTITTTITAAAAIPETTTTTPIKINQNNLEFGTRNDGSLHKKTSRNLHILWRSQCPWRVLVCQKILNQLKLFLEKIGIQVSELGLRHAYYLPEACWGIQKICLIFLEKYRWQTWDMSNEYLSVICMVNAWNVFNICLRYGCSLP